MSLGYKAWADKWYRLVEADPGLKEILSVYSRRWVRRPHDQWSRSYEYSFVLDALSRVRGPILRVLDFGGGFTFLPWCIQTKTDAKVYVVDNDDNLIEELGGKSGGLCAYKYCHGDVYSIERGAFQFVVCVSLLEHMEKRQAYNTVVALKQSLSPGGVLVLTFDVSVDPGSGGVSLPFYSDICQLMGVAQSFDTSKCLSTYSDESDGRLPWRFPFLSYMKSCWKNRAMPRRVKKELYVALLSYRNDKERDDAQTDR